MSMKYIIPNKICGKSYITNTDDSNMPTSALIVAAFSG